MKDVEEIRRVFKTKNCIEEGPQLFLFWGFSYNNADCPDDGVTWLASRASVSSSAVEAHPSDFVQVSSSDSDETENMDSRLLVASRKSLATVQCQINIAATNNFPYVFPAFPPISLCATHSVCIFLPAWSSFDLIRRYVMLRG